MSTLRCGPAKYTPGGTIGFSHYCNGEIAITIYNEHDGQPEARATVALPDAPLAASRGGVWLKGWSECEGLPEALEKAGVVHLTDEEFETGFVKARFAYLSDVAKTALDVAA